MKCKTRGRGIMRQEKSILTGVARNALRKRGPLSQPETFIGDLGLPGPLLDAALDGVRGFQERVGGAGGEPSAGRSL